MLEKNHFYRDSLAALGDGRKVGARPQAAWSTKPRMTKVHQLLDKGFSLRKTAELVCAAPSTVQRVKGAVAR